MIGQLLDGRYQVIRVLGAGGFGQTYIAQDTRRPGSPTCVVKHLKPATSDPLFLQTARRLFQSEAETLERLGNHDQIPRLLAFFEQGQEFYLVQEFIEGRTLTHELPLGQRLAEAQVAQMLREVLSILVFVHSQGVIHRDIKPDNIIRRNADNRLVLVDFGAVKQVRTQMASSGQGHVSATVAIGTPGYMPTEQGQGKPRPNSDIYALGMIGIQALTGLYPDQLQEDLGTGELIWQHLVNVSPVLVEVLTKMTRYHFKDRYQTATEALQALQHAINPQSSPSPHQPASSGYPTTEVSAPGAYSPPATPRYPTPQPTPQPTPPGYSPHQPTPGGYSPHQPTPGSYPPTPQPTPHGGYVPPQPTPHGYSPYQPGSPSYPPSPSPYAPPGYTPAPSHETDRPSQFKPLAIGCGCLAAVGVLIVIAAALPSLFGQSPEAKQAEAIDNIESLNRAQQDYRSENPSFSLDLQELQTDVPTETDAYSYLISPRQDSSLGTVQVAVPNEPDLKTYIGAVWVDGFISVPSAPTEALVCESDEETAITEPGDLPVTADGQGLGCPDGFSPV